VVGKAEGFLSKFFGFGEAKLERILHEYELRHITCEKCGDVMDFTLCGRLSMTKCPKCGDLVFVPLKIDDWWTMQPIGAGGFGSI
jgi:predicted nucleic-acid-binding Zn-ribbon protein